MNGSQKWWAARDFSFCPIKLKKMPAVRFRRLEPLEGIRGRESFCALGGGVVV
jgi:hypothetical protein